MSVRPPPHDVIEQVFPFLIDFARRLSGVRVGPSIRLSSWYRDVETNARVGGHPDSQHRLGLAIDVVGDPVEREFLLPQLRQLGLVGVFEHTHVHIQLLPAGRARFVGLFGTGHVA